MLHSGVAADTEKIKALQDFVKRTVAPYKYPRSIEFRTELPKTETETGKLQRFKLKVNSCPPPLPFPRRQRKCTASSAR